VTDSEGPGQGDAQPKGEPEDRPELDIDSAFAAIVAEFSNPSPHGVGPWPASEDLDDDEPDVDHPDGELPTSAPDDTSPSSGAPTGRTARRRIVLPGDDLLPRADHPEPSDRGDLIDADTSGHTGAHRGDPPDDEDDEDRFVPPEPPPIPRGDVVSRLAWGAVIGGPLFLLIAALTWRTLPSTLLLVALLAFVGGFVTLVARMPQDHPDDPDDGAVV
jgi:hypothetical protein